MASKNAQVKKSKSPPLSVGKAVRYATTPGIVPLLKETFGTGFESIAILLAQIYAAVRLLPKHHPYLKEENFGRYTIRHVITEASNHLEWKRTNIDQIIIYFAILAAIVILFMQIALLAFGVIHFIMPQAFASSGNLAGESVLGFFGTKFHETDLAFNFLDYVFGVPDIFNSNISNPGANSVLGTSDSLFPSPFHYGLHALLQFYSLALLIVAALIFLYFVLVVVAETAQTGVPFGQRFQNGWVPLRLVMAIGLLIPLSHGLNASQYIALYTAKYASGMATNTWFTFNQAITDRMGQWANPVGEYADNNLQGGLVAQVSAPDITPIVQFMTNVLVCKHAAHLYDPNERILPYLVLKDFNKKDSNGNRIVPPRNDGAGWLDSEAAVQLVSPNATYVNTPTPIAGNSTGSVFVSNRLQGLITENRQAEIRFGEYSSPSTNVQNVGRVYYRGMIADQTRASKTAYVHQTCGRLSINLFPTPDPTNVTLGTLAPANNPAFDEIKAAYFQLIISLFQNQDLNEYAERIAKSEVALNNNQNGCSATLPNGGVNNEFPQCLGVPTPGWKNSQIIAWQSWFNAEMNSAFQIYAASAPFILEEDILKLGWAGAGLWYNKIAEINAAFINEAMNTPTVILYPYLMEVVRNERRKQDEAVLGLTQFDVEASNGLVIQLTPKKENMVRAMAKNYRYWYADGQENPILLNERCNVLCKFVRFIFTDELIDIRKNSANGVNPLGQISALGKALVESSVRALTYAAIAKAGEAVSENVGKGLSGTKVTALFTGLIQSLSSAAAAFLVMIALIGFIAGFILYYVIPFLPYIFFIFALVGWIKSIAEAMVGAPLWALAHLRIDGEGLPGKAASGGYFLLLDIFLKPVLIVVGLIAAIIIFSGGIIILNSVFDLLIYNTGGYNADNADGFFDNARTRVDQFFFTIVYTIIAYIMATSSFKLINEIPQGITRWIGSGAKSLADNLDPTKDLVRNTTVVAGYVGDQVGQQLHGAYKESKGIQKERELQNANSSAYQAYNAYKADPSAKKLRSLHDEINRLNGIIRTRR